MTVVSAVRVELCLSGTRFLTCLPSLHPLQPYRLVQQPLHRRRSDPAHEPRFDLSVILLTCQYLYSILAITHSCLELPVYPVSCNMYLGRSP